MNSLLTALSLVLCFGIMFFLSPHGAGAILVCALCTFPVIVILSRLEHHREFLLRLFLCGLLVRMLVGALIFYFNLQHFFGGDALAYDYQGYWLLQSWQGTSSYVNALQGRFETFWGMPYLVAAVYSLTGRNMLAIQFVNAVFGAATAPVIFLCSQHIFKNSRVSRLSALLVAFFPSIVLWSSQGLKDGPIIFLLSLTMLAALMLREKFSISYFLLLIGSLFGILGLRFYIFYMVVAAVVGGFLIGTGTTMRSLTRQFVIIVGMGLVLTYLGVLRTANTQIETFGDLEALQSSRLDLARSAESGYAKELDVSTTSGAISAIPIGMLYLLLAPFPWQMANLRQSITLPEMLLWWGAIPMLLIGLWFTLRYRLRQASPILLFTTMLTLAYSIFQGNVGTAYRQRAQILVFYFIFVAVGFVCLKEKKENQQL